jgi:malto-oligosyltrehalose trehalohydrolase
MGSTGLRIEFGLWASRAKRVDLQIVHRESDRESVIHSVPMASSANHHFHAVLENFPAGTLYRFQLDGGPARPDPYSRFQPWGVHGPSQVIDPSFNWTDSAWRGIAKRDLVIYELHVGSFTSEGTYRAAIGKFPQLVELGVTAIELLPLAQSPGRWNWGYDGVNYFAPRNTYGTPEDLKAMVDAAHAQGLAVIHDVVYNHVGPEGNYLNEFAHYRSKKWGTPWGDALNFDETHNRCVRDFVINNGIYWLHEFHFDGLRLDAIHYMFDDSRPAIIQEFAQRLREYALTIDRQIHLIAESNIYDAELLPSHAIEGAHYDAIWSDCLMHSLYSHGKPELRLTNRHYQGTVDLVDSLEHAYVFSAPSAVRATESIRIKHYPLQQKDYKSSLIMALQTHDSVGNHPHGKRLHQLIDSNFQRAAAPLILLYPSIPMLFMGEEWATSAPFPFFADFEDSGLRQAVDRGRQAEYPHHDWVGSPLPSDPRAFFNSKLNPGEDCPRTRAWYRQLLSLRRRGLLEGWLDIQFKRTETDLERQIFSLVYETPQRRITIAARLAGEDLPAVRIQPRSSFNVLLDSLKPDQLQPETEQAIEFAPRHCCIWEE